MALLKWPSEVAQMLVDGLVAGLPAYGFDTDSVYYGDRMPTKFPAVTVEVADNPIEVRYVTRTVRNFAAYLMVYHGRYNAAETTRKAADVNAENVAKVLNVDPQWKDSLGQQRLVYSWVTRIQPGYAKRDNAILYVARLTWEAQSQAPL